MKKRFLTRLSLILVSCSCMSCSPFIFDTPNGTGGNSNQDSEIDYEEFTGCKNSIFFALYNYYGYEKQHFTSKWEGMNDALSEHGITVTGWQQEKDARKFKIKREADCDLPEDAQIYMVNNQNWDTGIQYNKPIVKYQPMAILSTCNGVEFASSVVASSGIGISNATMGGFAKEYREAFANGTLKYLCAKYSAHLLPIFAACVNAVDNGKAMKNADKTALSLSIVNWNIQSLKEYDEMAAVDSIDMDHPTMRKINVDKFFDDSTYKIADGSAAKALSEYVADSSKESIKALYELNGTNQAEDEAGFVKKDDHKKEIKCGIIAPSSVNSSVQSYIDFIQGYCAKAYGVTMLPIGSVTSSDTQDKVAKTLISQGADFIISLQDDTNRNAAAEMCNNNNVFFAIGGSCQNPKDYDAIKMLPYYVGSIGTSIDEERRAAKEMTEYYLQCMIHRAKGDLKEFETLYKTGKWKKEED